MDSSDKNCGCLCGAKFFDVKQSYSLPIRFFKKKVFHLCCLSFDLKNTTWTLYVTTKIASTQQEDV